MRAPNFLLVLALAGLAWPAAAQDVHEGVLLYNDGSRYEGGLVDGKPHGRGVLIYNSGGRLSGSWANGKWIPGSPQLEARPSEKSPGNWANGKWVPQTLPVAGYTFLTELPAGSKIFVKTNISIDAPESIYYQKVLYGKKTGWKTSERYGKKYATAGQENEVDYVSSYASDLSINLKNNWGGIEFSASDGELPRTVDDFDRRLGHHFQIIYDNPAYNSYPGMDKETVADLLMAKITAATKANEPDKALPHFARLEKLGVTLPESFYYYYIESLEGAGKRGEARARVNDYLKKYGRQGKYYAQVIEMMSRLDTKTKR